MPHAQTVQSGGQSGPFCDEFGKQAGGRAGARFNRRSLQTAAGAVFGGGESRPLRDVREMYCICITHAATLQCGRFSQSGRCSPMPAWSHA